MRSKIVLAFRNCYRPCHPYGITMFSVKSDTMIYGQAKAGPWQAQPYKPLKQPRTGSHTSSRDFPNIVRLWDLPWRTKNQAERHEAIRDGSGTTSRHIRPNWSVS